MASISSPNRRLYVIVVFIVFRPDQLKWKANEVVVPAGEAFSLPIHVERGGSILSYGFETKGYDINFGIDAKDERMNLTELMPMTRVESQNMSEQGKVEIKEPSLVTLKWDNSYSWMTNKTLSYTITLTIPAPTKSDLTESAGLKLKELESHRAALSKAKESLNQNKEEESNIQQTLKVKNEELERLQNEIKTIESNCQSLKNTISRIEVEINYEIKSINDTCVFGVFEVCGNSIVKYLKSGDLLNLGMASRQLTSYTRDKDLWKSIFEKEDKNLLKKSLNSKWLNMMYAELYPESDIANKLRSTQQQQQVISNNNSTTTSTTTTVIQQPTPQLVSETTISNNNNNNNEKPNITVNTDIKPTQSTSANNNNNNNNNNVTPNVASTANNSNSNSNSDIKNKGSNEESFEQMYSPMVPTVYGQSGWYKNSTGSLFYFVFNNNNEGNLLIGPITPFMLQELIEKAKNNEVLIACPGTIQGESGCYINKKGVVSQWEVKNDQWIRI